MTASVDVRAQRRLDELLARGTSAEFDEVRREVAERDLRTTVPARSRPSSRPPTRSGSTARYCPSIRSWRASSLACVKWKRSSANANERLAQAPASPRSACIAWLRSRSLTGCAPSNASGRRRMRRASSRPLDAIPGDLDLVVRLDLRRIRDTLGAAAMTAIAEQAVHGLHGRQIKPPTLCSSVRSVRPIRCGWGCARPPGLEAADTVWVMVGHFPNFDPHRVASTPPFAPPIELGAAFPVAMIELRPKRALRRLASTPARMT